MKIHVPHVAKLANLELTDDEIKKFDKQLSDVLQYIDKLNQADTKDVEPTSQVTGLENVLREDITSPSLSQKDALSNAISQVSGQFQVKAILDTD